MNIRGIKPWGGLPSREFLSERDRQSIMKVSMGLPSRTHD